ncbi:MAG: class II glutamine amidotransferase [Porcipelethomonas sp.]
MCELLGFSSDKAVDVRLYLRTFYHHSVHHPHGWGLMREHCGKTEIIKEPVCATGSRILGNIIDQTEPQKNAMAHIRMATVGAIKTENCHPYSGTDNSGRCWTLIHNGTVYSGRRLTRYLNIQSGDTDSERIFLYLLDEINKAQTERPLTAQERFRIVDDLVISLSSRNKLNLIIFDGELMYVHKNMKDTLYYHEDNRSIVFSTKPLDDGKWESFPLAQVCAFHDGEKVFEGTEHGGVYIPTLEYITAMDAMNI